MVQSATAQIFATFSIMPDRRRRIKKGVEPYFLFVGMGTCGVKGIQTLGRGFRAIVRCGDSFPGHWTE